MPCRDMDCRNVFECEFLNCEVGRCLDCCLLSNRDGARLSSLLIDFLGDVSCYVLI